MIDKIAIIAILILYILVAFISLFTYLVIRGANENKTDEERKFEDEEQMNYLEIYKNKKLR